MVGKYLLLQLIIRIGLTNANLNWWKNAAFYEIYIRSFKDSNNDGIGDLQGIKSKLDYLKHTGITAAFLSPIYQSSHSSPTDEGCISNYTEIDGSYGTLEDFDDLLEEAHSMDIRIVIDFVPNHSCDQHQWFKKSINKQEPYTDYYVWKDGLPGGPPNNWICLFNRSAWTYNAQRDQYYLHQFTEEQPDLNYNNIKMVNEIKNVLKFWLDRGVDGFRMNAVSYIFEDDQFRNEPIANGNLSPHDYAYLNHIYTSDLPKTFNMVYEWRKFIDDYTKTSGGNTRVLITEAYTNIENTMKYYGSGAHFSSNLQFITNITRESTARDTVLSIKEWFAHMPPQYTANWMMGNRNSRRIPTRFNPERIDAINALVTLLPGIAVTYYGEEIGQEDGKVTFEQGKDPQACDGIEENFNATSRDFERTPFQWNNSTNAGFNDGAETWLPVSKKYIETNLETQNITGAITHYNIYKHLLKLRQELAFLKGAFNLIALSENVLAFTRSVDKDNTYIVLINVFDVTETVNVSVFKEVTKFLKVVICNSDSSKQDQVLFVDDITMSPYEVVVAKTQGDQDWWKHAVLYHIYTSTFKDDTNDGIGDLKGVITKLEYLQKTGITALWLSTIYDSPQDNDGFDIRNFNDIDKRYGTLDDFKHLIKKAHELRIKIIMDFVPNHSSIQHEWFKKSVNSEKGYRDFYIWRDSVGSEPPNNWVSRVKGVAWEYNLMRKQYYLHQFGILEPDLNYRNPMVVEEMKKVLKFWLDLGVDGFCINNANYLFEDDEFKDEPLLNSSSRPDEYGYLNHIYTVDQSDTFSLVYDWRDFIDNYTEENGGDARILIGEVYSETEATMKYYGSSQRNGTHFTLNFLLARNIDNASNAVDLFNALQNWLNSIPSNITSTWLLGDQNHHRVATRLGPANVDSFNMLGAFLPGILITYSGEEIGQENGKVRWDQCRDPNACSGSEKDFEKTSRDFERTPFQWDKTINAGFNSGTQPWLPISIKYFETNLNDQSDESIITHYEIYKRLLQLRTDETLRSGNLELIAITNNSLALKRTYLSESLVLVFNIGNKQETFDLNPAFDGLSPYLEVVLTSTRSAQIKGNLLSAKEFRIKPYEGIMMKLTQRVPKTSGGNNILTRVSYVTVLALVLGIWH